jgi:hypothetical protein
MNAEKSMLAILADEVAKANGHEMAPKLYRLVSELVRSRLDPRDAAIVAAWFDHLADGVDPRTVFVTKSRGGRPRKSGVDDYDIAWIVHTAICEDCKPDEVYKSVGKAHGLKPRTVSNIYSRLKAEVSKLHKNLP